MIDEYEHQQALRITLEPADYHELNRQARKLKKPLKDFVEWMLACYTTSTRQEQQARAK